jgi:arylsulfatase A-like enzyme
MSALRRARALLPLALLACGAPDQGPPPATGNVLLLVADDIGTDKVGVYAEHPHPAPTPNIDALAARGVLFRNAYAPPMCSPSRATLLTGRLNRRYGLGKALTTRRGEFELPLDEVTIPEMLAHGPHAYASSAVGKWHLAGAESPSGYRHPLASGFPWYAGAFGNVRNTRIEGHEDYFHWRKDTNGRIAWSSTYATTDTVDDALARIEAMPEPWFLWVAFNAAHYPLHEPPAGLYSARPLVTPADAYHAMVEALDREIGRLLASVDPQVLARTTVILLADNGTPKAVVTPPRDPAHFKRTLYEGGINVPLIVAGPEVARPGSESAALVHVVDVFPTVAEIAEVDLAALRRADGGPLEIDGRSLLPFLHDPDAPSRHATIYQDFFAPNGDGPYRLDEAAIRDERWKLLHEADGTEEFFDLRGRVNDGPNLLGHLDAEQRAAYERLGAELERTQRALDADRTRASRAGALPQPPSAASAVSRAQR